MLLGGRMYLVYVIDPAKRLAYDSWILEPKTLIDHLGHHRVTFHNYTSFLACVVEVSDGKPFTLLGTTLHGKCVILKSFPKLLDMDIPLSDIEDKIRWA